MARKAKKRFLTTIDVKVKTYKQLEKMLTENGVPFKKETGSYGGGKKVFYDYSRNSIVITSYLKRFFHGFTYVWGYSHYIIPATSENLEKLNKLFNLKITDL